MPGRNQKDGSKVDPALKIAKMGEALNLMPACKWRVAGASVQGVSHQRLDLSCQDAHDYRVLDGEILLVALADGAGSAEFSLEGAHAAVNEVLCAFEAHIEKFGAPEEPGEWQNLVHDAFAAARSQVLAGAEEAGHQPRDYATTLTGVIATPAQLVVGQIGDGAVVAEDESGELFTVTRLQRGEYANETHFLIQEDALDQIVIEVHKQPVRSVAVLSDGLIRLALKMPSQEPHVPFFTPLFRFISQVADEDAAAGQLAEFLSSERVNERTDDDKSLVLASRLFAKESGK